jgi:hypothetical protein
MKKIICILVCVILSGCAEKSRFDCPYGKGPSCLSMSEIDKHIKVGATTSSKSSCSKASCGKKAAKPEAVVAAHSMQHDASPAQRIPETVLQMWVSPYEASSGIYYQASYANIIVKDAAWAPPVLDDLSSRDDAHD